MTDQTIVHLLRHGEVDNPTGVLYGRRDGFHLSERGNQMAQRIADTIGDRDIVHLRTSPLERAQETAAPLAAARGLTPVLEPRVLESTNAFEGLSFADGAWTLIKRPQLWHHLRNPLKPSWGEPYDEIAARMLAAVYDARDSARGHEAVIVSHQLPIWTARLFLERRSYLHNPKSRQCTLCSLTSIVFQGETFKELRYTEPALDLIPLGDQSAPFSSGGAVQGERL